MGKETLSPEEIASLLPGETTDVQDGDSRRADDFAPADASERPTAELGNPSNRLSIGGEAVIGRLGAMSGELARAISAALSELLRTTVEVDPSRVDRLTYGEFVLYRNDPTCFALLQSDAAPGPFALDIEVAILFPMIERLLGGDLQRTTSRSRPLTGIEQRLATRIVELFLQELRTVWQQVSSFGLTVASIESEPRKTEPLLSKESVACIQLQVVIGSSRGAVCLAVPWNVVEKPSAFGNDQDRRRQPPNDSLPGDEVELSVVLAQTRLAATDVQSLKVGDVISTENEVGDPLEVTVADDAQFRATPGVLNGHKAIRIE